MSWTYRIPSTTGMPCWKMARGNLAVNTKEKLRLEWGANHQKHVEDLKLNVITQAEV